MNLSPCEKDHLHSHIFKLIQPVLDSLGEMQDLWLKFVDTSGDYILTSKSIGACDFCSYIRSNSEGLRSCQRSARLIVEKSREKCGPIKEYCHAGLTTITVPVMIGQRCLGALLAGQILEEDHHGIIRKKIPMKAVALGLEQDRLLHSFDLLPIWTEERISVMTRSLHAFSNCFIEIGVTAAKKEKTELEKSLKEMELKALQNQINPHFLFNTLNTIEMLAMMEGAKQTPIIVHSLAQLFRHNLFSGSCMVTVRQEMDSVDSYLNIQKFRFGSRLKVTKRISSNLLDCKIPVLTLQPLVENAIIHGIEPLEKNGLLILEGFSEKDNIIFQVTDNGAGMTEERLSQLQNRLSRLDSEANKIGLMNVQKRCRLHFGHGYGIGITSTPEKGTTVSLRVPATKAGVGSEVVNS